MFDLDIKLKTYFLILLENKGIPYLGSTMSNLSRIYIRILKLGDDFFAYIVKDKDYLGGSWIIYNWYYIDGLFSR